MKESVNESVNSLKKKVKDSELLIQELSKALINDLNAGRWDYIEWWNDYLKWLDGSDKFPNKVAHDMIRAWRWDEVLRHIEKFEPTQTLAKELLKDMLKRWFYEDKEYKSMGYNRFILEDSVSERETFLSRFWELDNTTALLVLELLNKNLYEGDNDFYKSHLGDCFNPKYFTGLDEKVLKRLSNRWKVIEDEDKNSFVWIDNEKREKYTKIALEIQKKTEEEENDNLEDLERYLKENYE